MDMTFLLYGSVYRHNEQQFFWLLELKNKILEMTFLQIFAIRNTDLNFIVLTVL